MVFVLTSWLAMLGYLIGSWMQRNRLFQPSPPTLIKPSWIAILAWLIHGISLYSHIFSLHGVLLGLGSATSLAAWSITGIVIFTSFYKPTGNLLIVIMPLSALCLAFALATPPSAIPVSSHTSNSLPLLSHILFSFLAYALLAVAALLAIILAYQNAVLKKHHTSALLRALPPLQAMESLLFEMLAVGVVLLTLALITGFIFLQDMLAQKVAHKTVLSICAWFIFAGLLTGHYRFGWRGRIAVRWTLFGFTFLLVAYFGSKLVVEYLL